MERINIVASFDLYKPIDNQAHYVFLSDNSKYLINCKEYPELLGELAPNDLVSIEADISEQCLEGIKLVNVRFGGKDE